MKQFLDKTVLVPWDFSDMSLNALNVALEMVDSPDKIEVVHVTEYPSAVDPGVVWGTTDTDSIQRNLAKSFAEQCHANGLPALKFTSRFGDPGSQITEIASSSDVGLIVISSHGRTGLKRMLLGSVAERVVRLAPCPVLVLREQA